MSQGPILVVDDEPANLALMHEILGKHYKLVFAANGLDALAAARKHRPAMVLLDIQLPDIDGYEVCRQLMADPDTNDSVILFVTNMSDIDKEAHGFELGAVDYIVKPISPSIVLARVKAHLSLVRMDRLEKSYSEAIYMLGDAAHFNDEVTGVHIWRMAAYSGAIARAAGCDEQFCRHIELAAAMHDTGKIGIPQAILQKPAPLDAAEWQIMKTHAQVGYDILSRASSDTFAMAATIALNHHEKWDGSGYPNAKAGSTIPIEARIVAIADVFDALTMKRPYKEPWPIEKAIQAIQDGSGAHFDPTLVAAFLGILPKIELIRSHWLVVEENK